MDAARELRELRRIERWLTVNDPELAAMLTAHGGVSGRPGHRWVRLTVDAVGAVSVVIGMLTGLFTVAFLGVLVLMTGACLHTTCRRQHRRRRASP
ncbi:DUF3040 domain-containing protein [Lentzea sp. DG1S-22]|uniref:DUF3040 domain-containing protein n=1 Tax=Lentzea sp. DG1S-22 TaxID=3108822 RepID=UPI002E77D1F9|nr:DUF3040 domain-containing protein [Lentzea sp. DG1S-22]WVH82022.1 DUF3040 domain-containing protein [Lentzea sp. DG1S-22]